MELPGFRKLEYLMRTKEREITQNTRVEATQKTQGDGWLDLFFLIKKFSKFLFTPFFSLFCELRI